MNMGGPSDHWYTDLFSWDRPAFGEPADSLVKDIRRFGGDSLLRDGQPLAQRLGRLWAHRGDDEPARGQLERELLTTRDRLRAEAEAGGWEVD